MIPREPAKRPQLGFLYLPPFRVQGISIAGEESAVQVPELDVTFDIGCCPRAALASKYVALSHGHMDHSAGIAYYFSQRQFQGMGIGTVICHPSLIGPIRNVMAAWVDLEGQQTPYELAALDHEQELEVKNDIYLRAFRTAHTPSSLGYVAIERRSKLRSDLVGLPQEKLVELKKAGQQITRTLEIPLVCYTGDTAWGDHFDRPDVLSANILITECTFFESGHRRRARVGKHLHLDDVIELLDRSTAEAVVLTHLSRRTHIVAARKQIHDAIPARHRDRVFVLMDSRVNRQRYEQQVRDAEAVELQ